MKYWKAKTSDLPNETGIIKTKRFITVIDGKTPIRENNRHAFYEVEADLTIEQYRQRTYGSCMAACPMSKRDK